MLSNIFLGMSLLGAEWVLYLLIFMSVISVAVMLERTNYYRKASQGLEDFRQRIRSTVGSGQWEEALKTAESRASQSGPSQPIDLEATLASAILHHQKSAGKCSPDVLTEIAHDSVVRNRLHWEKNLAILATIGSNAPFVGLFGTVLGIIKAFHDLSQQTADSAQAVTAGISEALVATAVGILVAIPAVVAFNLFQRKVKAAIAEAEALKSFLIGKLAG